jgi:ligand-binding sensor domain-containing protein
MAARSRPAGPVIPDEPYLQDVAEHFGVAEGLPSDEVLALHLDRWGRVWAGTAAGLAWREAPPAGGRWHTLIGGPVTALAGQGDDRVLAATTEGWLTFDAAVEPPVRLPDQPARAEPLADARRRQASAALGLEVRDAVADGIGHLWLATPAGIRVGLAAPATGLPGGEGAAWEPIDRTAGLPYEDVLCLSLGAAGEPPVAGAPLWAGLGIGAARFHAGRWDYFQGRRWLADDRVVAVAALPDGGAWLGTPRGLTHISRRPMTLAGMAALFEARVQARLCRRGYVAACRL